jgi:hypothetical protein
MPAPIISCAFPKSGTTIVSASTVRRRCDILSTRPQGRESQPSKEYATDHRVSCEAFPVLVSFQHSRAMAQSSCARITSTRTGESDAAISSSGDGLAFLFSFNLRPINPSLLQADQRTSGEFSPTPALQHQLGELNSGYATSYVRWNGLNVRMNGTEGGKK